MAEGQAPSAGVRYAVETLDLAVKGASVYGREDLIARLESARGLLSGSSVTVYVVGEFKQGKSSLINALVTQSVCPVDDDIATAVPTMVRHAAQPAAIANYEPAGDGVGTGWSENIAIEAVPSHVTETGNPGNHRRLKSVTIGVDRPLLASGLVLVDTPGVGGLGSTHNAVTVSSLPQSHAVLFVSDASQELTAPEVRFLRTVADLCPTIVFVLTKIDLYPEWRRIRDLDIAHLARAGVHVDTVAVSSRLRDAAARAGDQDLNVEAGFPPLVQRLQAVVRDAERVSLQAVGSHVLSAVSQIEPTLRSRAQALTSPERSAAVVAALKGAQDRADSLRDRSSRWQQLLVDGFADITSDIDFDLRQRSRAVLQEAEKAIDDGDPAKNWPEFEKWLRQRLAGEAMENYGQFTRRARDVAMRVAEHFELAASQVITPRDVAAPVAVLEQIEVDSEFAAAPKRTAGGFAAFQKAYGGVLMFTMLTHMAAIALPGPLGLGLGLLMGRAGFKDDRKRLLEKRRGTAKMAVRRFVDEFNLQVGKDSRDSMRRVQRELRDAYTDRVEELQRSTREALAAAQKAVSNDEAEAQELKKLRGDLESFELLRSRGNELVARSSPEAVSGRPAQRAVGAAGGPR